MSDPRPTATSVATRRAYIVGGALALIPGCSASPFIQNVFTATRTALRGAPDAPVSPEYVARLPYASMGAKVGRGQRSMLVLGRYDGPDRHWVSADRAALVTRNGRLTRLYGIGADLRDTRDIDDDPIAAATFAFEGLHLRTLDLSSPVQYGIPIESTFAIQRRETITILDRQHDTLVVAEENVARVVHWSFVNEYWLDFDTGYVWRSVQHFAPDMPSVTLEIYKRDA